ncbi:MAG: TonB-dependent receptor [Saprospiraceae bacterium]|nr:TonB-dependent receptor [Saprospiraceae bacterium]
MKQVLHLLFFLCAPHWLLAHGGTLKGLVTDAQTNTELPGATVRIAEPALSTATNELGMFSFNDLPAGEYAVTVTLIGYAAQTRTVRVSDHESAELKFELQLKGLSLSDAEIAAPRARPLTSLSQVDIQARPINSAQDILRYVPGLVIAQHAGGGKAEQIFLRGFDIDHGTDIALYADGIPVNMVSHAHGQGYADLHFIIPELIQRVDFQKGPHYANIGNLGTAGYVKFETPDALRDNFLRLEAGQFDHYRGVAAVNLLGKRAAARGTSAYVAGETMFQNGYFEAPQDFKRLNLFAKFRQAYDDGKVLTFSVSRFRSSWLASGQVPERAVRSGQIGPFGAIDPSEGGQTGRINLNLEHLMPLDGRTVLKNQFFLSQYDFELYSNFTFFLNDPVNGDQIRQRENRTMSGYNGYIARETALAGQPLYLEGGVQLRYDEVHDNELSRTTGRVFTRERVQLGDVQELNLGIYADANWQLSERFSAGLGLRFDQFHFSYHDKLDSTTGAFTQKGKNIINPKLNLKYALSDRWSVYAQAGSGFHSNDARVILQAANENILPRALGYEAGVQIKPFDGLLLSLAAWQLDLEQEFVYVGDEGIVEPGGKTRRQGLDVSLRWQPTPWLLFDADYNYTRPRATEASEGENYIPLAPLHTSIGGITLRNRSGLNASVRYRYLADRPANEDNSLVAEGFFLLDAQLAYAPVRRNGQSPVEFSLGAQNLANTLWKEAQFETTSRLPGESAEGVTEIHYTPGTPFFIKGGVTLRF